mmetsp:Transcript_11674/g.23896  ORF Transcript_11674/g.23896 Transcript_11674/m.23896 type:complete len:105 (-) Transcript_11674:2788-3102(-)
MCRVNMRFVTGSNVLMTMMCVEAFTLVSPMVTPPPPPLYTPSFDDTSRPQSLPMLDAFGLNVLPSKIEKLLAMSRRPPLIVNLPNNSPGFAAVNVIEGFDVYLP